MKDKEITVTADELQKQKLYTADVAAIMQVRAMHGTPKALVRTYGCQQNVADGERIKGMLSEMGFEFTEDEDEADFILFNTCAIREHAEDRVFGNIGALKNVKRRNPSLLIAVCGCMMEQERVAERIKASFPFVNIVFGTHVIHRLPEMMYTAVTDSKRVFLRGHESKEIIEGLPVRRDGNTRAWVTVMYGCDNFCSYCIVPYVRGREKSRHPDAIVAECRELIEQGYKEITLLGQNVNSYGKGLPEKVNFSELLRRIDAIGGDYRLRFMTSHPKDATHELVDTIAESRHICHYIHLPCQSGSSRVLKAMNRHYDLRHYEELLCYAREKMPGLSITSDIIVGFPGETREDFEKTLELVRRTKYSALFTFIYSRRSGTAAEKLPDPIPAEEKSRWFRELLDTQGAIGSELLKNYVGKTLRVLAEDEGKTPGTLSCRAEDNTIVEVAAPPEMIGEFLQVRITAAMNWALRGERI